MGLGHFPRVAAMAVMLVRHREHRIALVAGGLGACITIASSESLRLPGVVYRPLECAYLKDIELSCIHRRGDGSPVLAAFLAVVRG